MKKRLTNKTFLEDQALSADLIRFIVAGVINTLISTMLFLVLFLFFSHTIAYTISWITGIAIILLFYPTKVFPGSDRSIKRIIQVLFSYLTIFAICLWLLDSLIKSEVQPTVSILLTLTISTLLNFISMRFVLRNNSKIAKTK